MTINVVSSFTRKSKLQVLLVAKVCWPRMGRVLGKPRYLISIPPQMLGDAKGMFDPCSYAIALSVEQPIRAGKAPAPVGLAMPPPGYAPGFGPFLRNP